MTIKRKYMVNRVVKRYNNIVDKIKVVVKNNDNVFNWYAQFTAKNSDNHKLLKVFDDGDGVVITDSQGADFYLTYDEVSGLKAILDVDDYMEKIETVVKMKSIKPKGATIAYQGDPDDAAFIIGETPCDTCEEPWKCVGCKYEFGNG